MKKCLILITAPILFFDMPAGYAGNLMPNPGAEKILANPGNIKLPGIIFSRHIPAFGWGIRKSCGTGEFGITDKEKHSGKYSVFCKIKEKNSAGHFKIYIQLGENIKSSGQTKVIFFKTDTVYYFSCWVKAKGNFVINRRYLELKTDSGKPHVKYMGIKNRSSFYPLDKWEKYEIAFTVSGRTKKVVPVIQIVGTLLSKPGDVIFIDDIKIIPFNEKYPNYMM